MKSLATFITILLLACGAPRAFSAPDTGKVAIQLVFDDSGVLMEADRAKEQKIRVLGHLLSMTRARRYAEARIDLISTSEGRSVWIGGPSDLKGGSQTDRLLGLLEAHPDRCNNLPAAFAELETNIRQLEQQGYEEVVVIVLSSLIDTPAPCGDAMQITLPQLPPETGINRVLMSSDLVKAVSFYWVDHNQRRVWLEFLQPTSDWLGEHGGKFGLFDVENTVYELDARLMGVTR